MGNSGDAPTGVGKTALGVAMVRAQESRRDDRLFDDPYAAAFLAAAPGVFDREQRAAAARGGDMASCGRAFWSHAVVRTRFFDDYLLGAAEAGIRQLVLLAAGLDTRAYRLAWPKGVRLFELDLPEVLGFKDSVLTEHAAVARCDRTAVPTDFSARDWAEPLVDAGFRPGKPTAWLPEGLLIYLSADEAAHLLATVTDLSATGSRVAFEYDDNTDTMPAPAQQAQVVAEYAAMWKGGLPDARAWLADHGWRPRMHDRRTVAERHGRPADGPSTGGFVTATLAAR